MPWQSQIIQPTKTSVKLTEVGLTKIGQSDWNISKWGRPYVCITYASTSLFFPCIPIPVCPPMRQGSSTSSKHGSLECAHASNLQYKHGGPCLCTVWCTTEYSGCDFCWNVVISFYFVTRGMAGNQPHNVETPIDSFLEQFKRSAVLAMEERQQSSSNLSALVKRSQSSISALSSDTETNFHPGKYWCQLF